MVQKERFRDDGFGGGLEPYPGFHGGILPSGSPKRETGIYRFGRFEKEVIFRSLFGLI